jgi:membrane-bound metal-dependent hydrolase YbcI (DUF457 family)
MPFTPYHLSLGLLAKSLKPSKISLIMFGFSQIVIDLQQLYRHITHPNEFAYHGITHTILGATLIAMNCLLFKSVFERVFKLTISLMSAIYGVLLGVYTHLILDGFVHREVSQQLFWPLRIDSQFYGYLTYDKLNLLCMIVGIVSFGILGLKALWQQK